MAFTHRNGKDKPVRIKYGENALQFGDLSLPEGEGPYPVAVIIHGGFWRAEFDLEHIASFAAGLNQQGIATWNIEYRRVGQEGGGWPGTFTDVAQAVDYLSALEGQYPLDLNRVVLVGHSAGGHLACWLAARHRLPQDSDLNVTEKSLPVKGVVSLAGVLDLALMQKVHQLNQADDFPVADLIGGTPEEMANRYAQASPSELLPLGVPQSLIHGDLDINVPIGISQSYYSAAYQAGDMVNKIEIPSAEHFMLIDPDSEAWPIVNKEILALLRNEKSFRFKSQ